MSKVIREIVDDLSFIRSHPLEPHRSMVFKIFMIPGFLAGFCFLFGMIKTILFLITFLILKLGGSHGLSGESQDVEAQLARSVLPEEDGEPKATGIGKFCYTVVVVNLLISPAINRLLG